MALPMDVWLDEELWVMHADSACPGARVPRKYGYLSRVCIRTVEQARELDAKYRACEGCREKLTRIRTGAGARQYRYGRRGQQERSL